nr:AIR synthase related protein [Pseudobdellovibrionaceae bacterium]
AVTDCLNFGNPEKVEIMSEFVASVDALADAAKILDAPVVSGNVSFYNETLGKNIPPTPATGLVGLAPGVEKLPHDEFQAAGEKVYLISTSQIRSFHRLAEVAGEESRFTGDFDPKAVGIFIQSCLKLSGEVPFVSSKAVGSGGLFATLLRMGEKKIGFKAARNLDLSRVLEERLYEAVISVKASDSSRFEKSAASLGLSFESLGETGGNRLDFGADLSWSLDELQGKTQSAWGRAFGE